MASCFFFRYNFSCNFYHVFCNV